MKWLGEGFLTRPFPLCVCEPCPFLVSQRSSSVRRRLTRGITAETPLGSLIQDGRLDSCLEGTREWGFPSPRGRPGRLGSRVGLQLSLALASPALLPGRSHRSCTSSCSWRAEMNPLPLAWYLPIPFPVALRGQGFQDEAARGPCVCVGAQLPAKWHSFSPPQGHLFP